MGYEIEQRYGVPPGYYDRNGDPMPLMCWANMMNNNYYRIVARTEFGPNEFVSTVWIGLPGAFLGPPPGLIFETMIFAEASNMNEGQWRYSSIDEAIAGHDVIALALAFELKYV